MEGTNDNVYPHDIQFAGLVEAATAAAGQNHAGSHSPSPGAIQPTDASYVVESTHDPLTESDPAPRKRRRLDQEDKQEGQYFPIPEAHNVEATAAVNPDSSEEHTDVAAALFREPSTKSRRYTRPPMFKLYSSLQLTPENFLLLQSAAKTYMLDEDHPERRDCVGQRGASDNVDIVKLKLWNCVKDFLTLEGRGQEFWGANSDGPGYGVTRTLLWPRDQQQIIQACLPLLRRMVTNERQRKYAAVSRKSEKSLGRKAEEVENGTTMTLADRETDKLLPPPEAFEDIIHSGSTPTSQELDLWLRDYDAPQIRLLKRELHLDMKDLSQVAANIDAHLRLFHKSQEVCVPSCKHSILERLKNWLEEKVDASENSRGGTLEATLDSLFETRKQTVQTTKEVQCNGAQLYRNRRVPGGQGNVTPRLQTQSSPEKTSSPPQMKETNTKSNLDIHVNILSSGRRVIPRFTLTQDTAANLETLRETVSRKCQREPYLAGKDPPQFAVKVWLPDGLVQVNDDGEWMVALLSAGMVEWMDGEVRVLIEA